MNEARIEERRRVLATANVAAAFRALEAEKGAAALVVDECAAFFAGDEAQSRVAAMNARQRAFLTEMMAVRTRCFDEECVAFLSRFLADGSPHANGRPPAQAVFLGAGYDSRAYRLREMRCAAVYEADQAALFPAKTELLRARGIGPTAERVVPVEIDFAEKALIPALLAAGFDPAQPTIWVAEGLLPYLSEAVAKSLVCETAAISAAGSKFAATMSDRSVAEAIVAFGGAPRETGGNRWQRSCFTSRDDGLAMLAAAGWAGTQRSLYEIGAAYGRGQCLRDFDCRIVVAEKRA
jgi:methyltransferase (TIGR00027 family)